MYCIAYPLSVNVKCESHPHRQSSFVIRQNSSLPSASALHLHRKLYVHYYIICICAFDSCRKPKTKTTKLLKFKLNTYMYVEYVVIGNKWYRC
jgi:hypothetical protein